ncbi:hypothetical protein MNBD_GAMMA22-666 [hydrothermal vent metagenome]|uniref:Uncharacterized protein n=1 Tax=hydrothermal vent metagenome TaxID=652676 RepID=A0A3B1A0N5_9ZZZZ
MTKSYIVTIISTLILMISLSNSAYATPSFASKYEKKCSYCHNAWPMLNAKGRDFRERGYRFKEDLKGKSSAFLESGSFPISALINSRPYDKKKSGKSKLRALQEVELFIGGAINNNVSAFFEVEAEDDANSFAPELANMAMSYRINDMINIHASYAPSYWADSYGFIGSQFRITRNKVGFISQSFGGADGTLRDRRQNFEVSGRIDKLFYTAGVSGAANDSVGANGNGVNIRVAYDITKNIMFGGFIGSGVAAQTNTALERKYSRNGIDFQSDFGASRVQAAYIIATDDNTAATSELKNNAYSIQYIYHMKTATGSPTFVPVVRIDNYEKNNGNDKYQELTLNLTYYIHENFKSFIEYWYQASVPDTVVADNRTTLQFSVGF